MILVSILCIDERSDELSRCIERLEMDPLPKHCIGVFRESDVKCQKILPNYLTVPDYKITDRHNMDNMVKKRNLALEYGKKNKYKRLLYIDSDILITPKITLTLLLHGCNYCDICLCPYPIRWDKDTAPILAYANPDGNLSMEPVRKSNDTYQICLGGGMGCTMINLESDKIPKFVYGIAIGIEGEDIGFFIEAFKLSCRVFATTNHIVEHII